MCALVRSRITGFNGRSMRAAIDACLSCCCTAEGHRRHHNRLRAPLVFWQPQWVYVALQYLPLMANPPEQLHVRSIFLLQEAFSLLMDTLADVANAAACLDPSVLLSADDAAGGTTFDLQTCPPNKLWAEANGTQQLVPTRKRKGVQSCVCFPMSVRAAVRYHRRRKGWSTCRYGTLNAYIVGIHCEPLYLCLVRLRNQPVWGHAALAVTDRYISANSKQQAKPLLCCTSTKQIRNLKTQIYI